MSEPIYTKMDPKVKKVWVKALRSRKYKQATSVLCTADGRMCCLGVAADVLIEADWELNDNGTYYALTPSSSWQDANVGLLDSGHLEQLGLDNATQEKLAMFNDDYEWTFGMIADWIEENL